MSKQPVIPEGYNTVNPFIITENSVELLKFISAVFGGEEQKEALTYDSDGLVLHSEIKLGNSMILIADRKPDWAVTPGFLQIYVADVEKTLEKAEKLGAKIVTKPTEFIGVKFSRMLDSQGNLWWVYEQIEDYDWESAFGGEGEESEGNWKPTEEATYIYDTLIEAMRSLNK